MAHWTEMKQSFCDTGWIEINIPNDKDPKYILCFRAKTYPKIVAGELRCGVAWSMHCYDTAKEKKAELALNLPCACEDSTISSCPPGTLPDCNVNPPVCKKRGDGESCCG